MWGVGGWTWKGKEQNDSFACINYILPLIINVTAKLELLTKNEQKNTNEMKYTYVKLLPQYASPGGTAGNELSHRAFGEHASIILGQFSPVATLQ